MVIKVPKTFIPKLHLDSKKEIVKLYWQIYGLTHITNNKFMFWLAKCYIVLCELGDSYCIHG
jgi:hypothetical protein